MHLWKMFLQGGENVYGRRLQAYFLLISCVFSLVAVFLIWSMLRVAQSYEVTTPSLANKQDNLSPYHAPNSPLKHAVVSYKKSTIKGNVFPKITVGYERITLRFDNRVSVSVGDHVGIVYGVGDRRVRLFSSLFLESIDKERSLATLQVTPPQREVLARLNSNNGRFFLSQSLNHNDQTTSISLTKGQTFMPEPNLPVTIVRGGSLKKILPQITP